MWEENIVGWLNKSGWNQQVNRVILFASTLVRPATCNCGPQYRLLFKITAVKFQAAKFRALPRSGSGNGNGATFSRCTSVLRKLGVWLFSVPCKRSTYSHQTATMKNCLQSTVPAKIEVCKCVKHVDIFFFTSGLHRDAKVFLHPTAQSLEHLAKEILDNKWEYRLLLKLKTNGNSAKLWNLHQSPPEMNSANRL